MFFSFLVETDRQFSLIIAAVQLTAFLPSLVTFSSHEEKEGLEAGRASKHMLIVVVARRKGRKDYSSLQKDRQAMHGVAYFLSGVWKGRGGGRLFDGTGIFIMYTTPNTTLLPQDNMIIG